MSNNRGEIIDLIKQLSGQANILTIPRLFIDLLKNDIHAALLLSQCIYWSDRTRNPDGWFYKSAKEWQDEICLTRYQIEKAIKASGGIIEKKIKKANGAPTCHYRVNFEKLTQVLSDFQNFKNGFAKNLQMDLQKTCKSLTETTTEITTEIKNNGGLSAPAENDFFGKNEQSEKERREKERPSTKTQANNNNPLAPSSPGALLLMRMLNDELKARAVANDRGWRGCKQFESLAQKQKFEQVESRLNGELGEAIKAAFEKGIVNRAGIISYIGGWGKYKQTPSAMGQPPDDYPDDEFEAFARYNPHAVQKVTK